MISGIETAWQSVVHHEAGHAASLWGLTQGLRLAIPNGGLLSIAVPSAEEFGAGFERYKRDGSGGPFIATTDYDHQAWAKEAFDKVGERKVAETLVIQNMAGLIAEYRFLEKSGASLPTVGDYLAQTRDDNHLTQAQYDAAFDAGKPIPDMDRARHFMRIANISDKQAAKLTRDVIFRPRMWGTIEALAAVLQQQNRMTGEEAARVMQVRWFQS